MVEVKCLNTFLVNGYEVSTLEIRNQHDTSVLLTNYGARLMQVNIPDHHGVLGNVVVGYSTTHAYLSDPYYMGAIIGRVANRIRDSAFSLEGKRYQLIANDGIHCNHGGTIGFHNKIWKWEEIRCGVRFTLSSPDGEGGWPGQIEVWVEYEWSDDNMLSITIEGHSNRLTFFNPTCHAYFNLSGSQYSSALSDVGSVLNHKLMIPFKRIVDTDQEFIPTGDIVDISGTAFDFSTPKLIGQDIFQPNISLRRNRGYNHCYVAKDFADSNMILQAVLSHQLSGRKMEVYSTLPGVLVYTAGYHERPHCAVCFETQYWPDYMHHTHFPQGMVGPVDSYHSQTKFCFSLS